MIPENMQKSLSKQFGKDIKFFKTWMSSPKTMGAVLPTSSITAKKMASLIEENSNGSVLELGPGTGVITEAILERGIDPKKLYSIEFEEDFVELLQGSFPEVNILHGNAFELDEVLKDFNVELFDAIISAIPLYSFPVGKRKELLLDLFDRVKPGHPIVQISYGPVSPIPPDWQTYTVEPLDWVIRNVPPARLWVYRRINQSV